MAEVRNTATGMAIPFIGATVIFHTAPKEGRENKVAAIVTGAAGLGLYEGDVSLSVMLPGEATMRCIDCAHYGRAPGDWSWPDRV